ncbi:MAG: hypothetical protein FWB85_08500 [Chitinispirillia bacterium]|nr:hypothetical protein [Chitinispirillia bacterium]MCL2242279.1 hypothetical protein [Chitinispirillia bacterium]
MATLDDVAKTLDRITRSMEESDKRRVETERILAESRTETERALAQNRTETERILAERRTETERILAESRAETERVMRQWASRVGNDIGYIVEVVLVPGIREKMNEFGHNFNRLSTRHEFYRKNGTRLTEVDVLLENGDESMAVEVKTRLTEDAVRDHVEQLNTLRENETDANLTGKTLYSAVAGLHIDEKARKLALSLGMYVVELYEDKSFISVIKPDVTVGTW